MAAARAAVRSTFSFQERRYSRDASGSRNARLSETSGIGPHFDNDVHKWITP